ncbi:MAG: monothiol glutaredoxin grx5 [Alectoria sarmentosa]|nr:MAG: monothiol glutaredoxin grx5 [Alectoria sarmentosa]
MMSRTIISQGFRLASRPIGGILSKPFMRVTPSQSRLLSTETRAAIDTAVASNSVVLFMKGTPETPQCGFSKASIQILGLQGVDPNKFSAFNVLEDEELRQGLKEYSDWPTIPQLYVGNEFVGGCDILMSMHQNGELSKMLEEKGVLVPAESSSEAPSEVPAQSPSIKMAKTTSDVKAHAKTSVATNALFKKAGKETLRQEKSRHMKNAIEKSTKASKSNKEYKAKHIVKHIPEHPLAAEFAESIEQSRGTIEEKTIAVLDATYLALAQRLVDSHDLFNQREQDAIKINDAFASPLKEQELEWTSTDGKQSGKTMLGVRMKKFQKTVEAEEKEFERQFDEWTSVQAEFRHIASLIVGPDGLDNLLAGNFDPDTFIDAEQREMMEEIEAEQKLFLEQIEQAGKEAMEAMTESERKLDLKQEKEAESFLAILRNDED